MPVNNVNLSQIEVWTKSRQSRQIKKWYIFYTRPRAEFVAEEMLVKAGFEVYLPKLKHCSVWKNRQKKTIIKPLIASYIFVFTSELQIEKVLANPKIVTAVTCGGKKAVLRQEDMDLLQRIERFQKDIKSTNNYQVGKRVRFIRDVFSGLEGKLILQNGKQRFGVELDALHYAVFIDLEMDQSKVEIISG
jgi:transcription antitermination factor NusG